MKIRLGKFILTGAAAIIVLQSCSSQAVVQSGLGSEGKAVVPIAADKCSTRTLLAKTLRDGLNFDFSPDFSNVVPGSITAVFKDDHKIRTNRGQRLVAAHSAVEKELNAIIDEHAVESVIDFAADRSEQALNRNRTSSRGAVANRYSTRQVNGRATLFCWYGHVEDRQTSPFTPVCPVRVSNS